MPPRPIILGTAGHIDHGKTSLVRALTGIDTDRLKEEKTRGITIELGFAHLDLGEVRLGIVDVPGHERFVKTMVAGASGVDLVLLVIAADEGIMPQTREHLDICELLGVRRGVVALTKRDLCDPEWLELVREDVRTRLAPTFLGEAPIVPCSSTTGAGLDALRDALAMVAAQAHGKDDEGPFRLPLDRVFTMRGFGTVVTGTLASGRVREGDEVIVLPGGAHGKVRGLEVHGESRAEARAGERVAANLQGIEREAIERGSVLLHPQTLEPTSIAHAELRYLPQNEAPLPKRSRLLFHAGTAQAMAACLLLDRERLEPGETGLVQFHLERPFVLLPDDRYITRGFAPLRDYGTTVGGGAIVRAQVPRARRSSPELVDTLRAFVHADVPTRVALELYASGAAGLTHAGLRGRIHAPRKQLDAALAELKTARRALVVDKEQGLMIHADALAALRARTLEHLCTFHAANPLREGVSREELRSKLPGEIGARLLQLVLESARERGELALDRELVRSPHHLAAAAAPGLREQVLALYGEAGLAPPRSVELPARLGAPARELQDVCGLLLREGLLVRVAPDLLFARAVISDVETRLLDHLTRHGQIDAQQFKELTGQSRKYSIPLGEYFDAQKVTMRIGDVRKLRG